MQFEEGAKLYSSEVQRKGGEDILYVNYLGAPFVPSLSQNAQVMERTIELLSENPGVSRVVFVQQKNYNYDNQETNYLLEIAQLHTFFLKQEKILSFEKLILTNEEAFSRRHNALFSFLQLLKSDPILAYRELKNILIQENVFLNKLAETDRTDQLHYVHLLEKILVSFEKVALIQKIKPFISQYERGDRSIYELVLRADVIPNFAFTRLVRDFPRDAEIIDQYSIQNGEHDKSVVTILRKKDEPKFVYHLSPPEHSLDEDHLLLLSLARSVLIDHQPRAEEFTDTERTRQVFFNISRDLLQDLSERKKINLSYSDLAKLATILVRHTIGFGLVEVFLQDKRIHDISLNAPIPRTEIFIRHQDFEECITNVLPSQEDADSWAAKFRMISGRPLDEANPILDTQLEIGNLRARIAIIQQPLSPDGLAYSLRRHRESPWTLPLFIKNKMLNPIAAGLLSFLIDGSRTLLIAGTRSSGKTSLLGSLMLEIIPKYRIIVIEDTLELPVESLRQLKYDILRMKVRSSLVKTGTELSAEEGIRTSLRLGDSALIVGEVRSVEAKALYEAMRVGALANVVAGTIHGASPYGVFDRVVNDLGVPVTSFKATDVIGVTNPIKTPDGLKSFKRLVQLSEVRKHWKHDPLEEGGFVDLLRYNVEKDELVPTDDLVNGDSQVIKDVASNVKGWAGDWDAVYDNILLRSKIKKETVNVAEKTGQSEILEFNFNARSNHAFHLISSHIVKEIGVPLGERVFPEWQKWLNQEIKKNKI